MYGCMRARNREKAVMRWRKKGAFAVRAGYGVGEVGCICHCWDLFFFFFQAEDGIRDYKVTGVQTCALPICGENGRQRRNERGKGAIGRLRRLGEERGVNFVGAFGNRNGLEAGEIGFSVIRSGERRGGEEGRSWGWAGPLKKKKKKEVSRYSE